MDRGPDPLFGHGVLSFRSELQGFVKLIERRAAHCFDCFFRSGVVTKKVPHLRDEASEPQRTELIDICRNGVEVQVPQETVCAIKVCFLKTILQTFHSVLDWVQVFRHGAGF